MRRGTGAGVSSDTRGPGPAASGAGGGGEGGSGVGSPALCRRCAGAAGVTGVAEGQTRSNLVLFIHFQGFVTQPQIGPASQRQLAD